MRVMRACRLISPAAAAVFMAIGLLTLAPAMAQSPSGTNPTEQAVSEQQLREELNKIQGRITIPDHKAATLEQPQGRDYRGFREGALPWIGAIAILGMLLLLAVFYYIRGPVRMIARETNIKLLRFNVLERLVHWMTATAFIILAVTGLNFIFGKRLLMPLIGPEAFSTWSQWAKFAHDFVSWAFMLGILIMLVMWIWDNLPDRYDAEWIKAGGGLFDTSDTTHPPADRFNAGQKMIFWSVMIGGALLSISGIFLLFPFEFADVTGMQWAQYVHAIVGILMIAVIIAHIYIGTLGMEGAYEAMGSGTVDLNWAKQHHSVWVEKQAEAGSLPKSAATPAE